MSRIYIYNSIIILCFFCLNSCTKDNPTQVPVPEYGPIMPIAIGNTWIYVEADDDHNDRRKEEITEKKTIFCQGSEIDVYVVSDWRSTNGGDWVLDNSKSLIKLENDQLFSYGWVDEADDLDEPVYYLSKEFLAKYPEKVGNAWIRNDNGVKWECFSIDEKLNTPAGTFECVVYRTTGQDGGHSFYVDRYYAPNVGFVASFFSGVPGEPGGWTKLESTNFGYK